jgi:hypothetical protein
MRRLPRRCRRVLRPGAPVASCTAGTEQCGIPAVPESLASRGQVCPEVALAGQLGYGMSRSAITAAAKDP